MGREERETQGRHKNRMKGVLNATQPARREGQQSGSGAATAGQRRQLVRNACVAQLLQLVVRPLRRERNSCWSASCGSRTVPR